ncbi:MAG: sigma-70 family RNA polymerase sigma factor [Planctomycetota bacterium]
MPDEIKTTDEALIEAYRAGNLPALDILLKRHELALRNFVLGFSWLKKDPGIVDEIIQEIFITIFKEIKNNRFIPAGPGSFKGWAYSIARHRCYNATESLSSRPKLLSKNYIESFPAKLEETRPEESEEITELEKLDSELNRILGGLSDESRQLLALSQQGKTYEEINKIEPFTKYSLVNLRRKVCDARHYVFKEVQKWQEKK